MKRVKHNGRRRRVRPFLLSRGEELNAAPVDERRLDELRALGELPQTIGRGLTIAEAAGAALLLPTVTFPDRVAPHGYGIFPPLAAEPVVRLRRRAVDAYGEPVPRRARGFVGCLWRTSRRPERVVFRLWFRGEAGNPHAGHADVRGPVDVYDDAIESIEAIDGVVPSLTGWQIGALDVVIPGYEVPDPSAS